MKLLSVKILKTNRCGGLLDGFVFSLRSPREKHDSFDPICLIGPNGTGKSQILQVLAEIFQSLIHACAPEHERIESDPDLEFELEYLIRPRTPSEQPPQDEKEERHPDTKPQLAFELNSAYDPNEVARIRVHRKSERGRRKPALTIERRDGYDWTPLSHTNPATRAYLPTRVVGYTSGDNETLSRPFLVSRSGYAEEVGRAALSPEHESRKVPDSYLVLIDYSTNLEVLIANLIFSDEAKRRALLQESRQQDILSFRCVIQLAHSKAPRLPRQSSKSVNDATRKGIQLTRELEEYIENLQKCATCHYYDEQTETYTLDYWVNDATRQAFATYWNDAFHLYSVFHKLAMLNDLVLPKRFRKLFQSAKEMGNFSNQVSEPHHADKVFRFENILLVPYIENTSIPNEQNTTPASVPYISLSDGEHQLAQLLGMLCMLDSPNVLFLLDEPESHFNPQWRVKFISRLRNLPTQQGMRGGTSPVAEQECLLTTHAPFVPSDMKRDRVCILSKESGRIRVRRPEKETYGATFDVILEECFGVHPPMSELPREDIKRLMESEDLDEIRAGLNRLGDSIDKIFLADHLRQVRAKQER